MSSLFNKFLHSQVLFKNIVKIEPDIDKQTTKKKKTIDLLATIYDIFADIEKTFFHYNFSLINLKTFWTRILN